MAGSGSPSTPSSPADGDWTDLGPCGCCGYYYYYYAGGPPVLEPCPCPDDCTVATRYLTITGTSDCDGTYPLTCEMIDYGGGLGTHPAWSYTGPFGFDDFGYPCEGDETSPIWRLKCGPVTGIYTIEFQPPAEGVSTYTAVEQQCDPFYARFLFEGIIGLVPCCDYTGTPVGVVTD